ncbi:hypothetical protein Tco_0280406 [Tanacetum coccineum]
MTREVTNEEIKSAMFDIGDNKASGPDRFTSCFFKKSWNIMGKDVCEAVREFFKSGKLLGEMNATLMTLVSKIQNSRIVSDYIPIACCNVLYKCINDLLVLCHRNVNSIEVIKKSLVEFGSVSRLNPNMSKSTIFFGSISRADMKESLWVKWAYLVKLKGKSVWDINIDTFDSWFWKNLMGLREKVRPHIMMQIGNGQLTSMWFDRWDAQVPLSNFINRRIIYAANLSYETRVANMMRNVE